MERADIQEKPVAALEALARAHMQNARPVATVVVDLLRQAIVGGLLRAGQVLRQDELAATFGVSRMPIREGLRQLESEGLVRHLPRRGFVVAAFTPEEIAEIYELRQVIEGHAMRLAVPRLDDAQVEALERLLALMRQETDPSQRVELRETFYRTIYEAAGRPRLARLIMQMRSEVTRYLLGKRAPFSIEAHAQVLEICRRRDGRAAQQFIAAHLRKVADALERLIEDESGREPVAAAIQPGA